MPVVADDVDGRVLVDLERELGQALFEFVRRFGLTESEARDAVQEVFLRLWQQLRTGQPMDNARGWAYRTAYRLAMDEHRLRRRVLAIGQRLLRRPERRPTDVDERIVLWAEVDRLPERQRAVLYLRYRADLPFDDIATILGITASAARSHATQAMAALRRRLGPEGIG